MKGTGIDRSEKRLFKIRMTRVRILVGDRLSFPHNVQTGSGVYPAYYTLGTGNPNLRSKEGV
jgi:hypothetical protein